MYKVLLPIACIPLLAYSANSKEPPKSSPITVDKVNILEAGGFVCNARPAKTYIGQKADVELAKTILSVTGATVLRWAPPRAPISRDYRVNRVTIAYDSNYVITSINCG